MQVKTKDFINNNNKKRKIPKSRTKKSEKFIDLYADEKTDNYLHSEKNNDDAKNVKISGKDENGKKSDKNKSIQKKRKKEKLVL